MIWYTISYSVPSDFAGLICSSGGMGRRSVGEGNHRDGQELIRCTGITGSKADLHDKLKRIVDDAAMDPLDAQSKTVSDGEEELEIDDEDSGLMRRMRGMLSFS